MVPLALLPFPADVALWTALSLVALGAIVVLSFRPLLRRVPAGVTRVSLAVVVTVLFMVTYPVGRNLALGQVEIFLALACILDIVPARTPWPRGVLIGLATAVKLTPGLFIVYFIVTRQWRCAATAIGTTLAAWAAAVVVFPTGSRRYFFDGVALNLSRVGGVTDIGNQSLWGTMHRAFGADGQVPWLVAAALVTVFGMVRARAAAANGQLLAAATIVGLTSVLISPVSWLHHGIWLVPAVGLLVGDGRSRARLVTATAVVVLMLTVQPYPSPLVPLVQESWFMRYVVHESFVLLYLVLLAIVPTGLRTVSTRPRELARAV
jgi:alpha-1,2-mannosyltransferase